MSDEQSALTSSPTSADDRRTGMSLMTKTAWLTVGLQLIGVVFAVYSLAHLSSVAGLLASSVTAGSGGLGAQPTFQTYFPLFQGSNFIELLRFLLYGSLQPLTYLLAAYILIRRTDICVKYLNRGPSSY